MPLYKQSGVSVESSVTLSAQVPMHYETDPDNDQATLFFGQDTDYVLVLTRADLAQVISLGTKAIAELETTGPDDS